MILELLGITIINLVVGFSAGAFFVYSTILDNLHSKGIDLGKILFGGDDDE